MATLEQLQQALIAADKAGATDDARRLAQAIIAIKQAAPVAEAPSAPEAPAIDDPGFAKSMLIGAGRTFDRVGKGAQQLYYGAKSQFESPTLSSLVTGKTPSQIKLDQLKAEAESDDKYYKPLAEARPIATGLGESLPSLVIPAGGGATLAANAGRMALAGAIPGALEYGTMGERAGRAAAGAAAGVAVPALAAVGKTAKGFVEPLYQGGREAIASRLLNKVAGSDAAAVAARLKAAGELVPGSLPTAAQVAENGGIAALERAASQANPSEYTARAMEQASARLNALRGIAGDDAAKEAQQKIVNETAKRFYGDAFKESIDVTPDLVKLASRPSMRAAEKRAVSLADELSQPFNSTLSSLKPQFVPLDGRRMSAHVVDKGPPEFVPIQRPEVWIDVQKTASDPAFSGLGLKKTVNDVLYGGRAPQRFVEVPGKDIQKTLDGGRMAPEFLEIPPVSTIPVKDVHTLKMGMDALLSDRTLGIAGREADAIRATRERLLALLPDSYQAARQAHIDLNKPIHQMEIASDLLNKLKPALSDHGAIATETAKAYATALRNSDAIAKNATGLKNATIENIMTPQQMGTLSSIAADLGRVANAQNLGRGAGSDTFQKIAMSNIAEQSGMPRMMGGLLSLPGVNRATRWIYSDADQKMQGLLADALLNPQQTAKLMTEADKKLLANNPKTRKVLEQSLLRAGLLGSPPSYSLAD